MRSFQKREETKQEPKKDSSDMKREKYAQEVKGERGSQQLVWQKKK